MTTNPSDYRRWLDAEERGEDEIAEALFSGLVAALPQVEPHPEFADRVVAAAWRATSAQRRLARAARVAAAILVGVAGLAAMSAAVVLGSASLGRGALAVADAVFFVLKSVAEGVWWWSVAGRVGASIGHALATPSTVVVMVALELMVAGAIYTCHRLLREVVGHDREGVGA